MKKLNQNFYNLPFSCYGGIFLMSKSIDDQINMRLWLNIKVICHHSDDGFLIRCLNNLIIKDIYKI